MHGPFAVVSPLHLLTEEMPGSADIRIAAIRPESGGMCCKTPIENWCEA
jgi:hypothetical protein